MIKRIFTVFICTFMFTCLLSSYCAAGGDSGVYSRKYVDSSGNQSVLITNRAAADMNRYVKSTQDGCYVYKNYTRLTPNNAATIQAPSVPVKSCGLKTPYSELDVSFVSNSNRFLDPIIVNCPAGQMDISPIIMSEARRYNVDPILVKTVIKFESGFCGTAVSPAGASGLMQLMPGTAEVLGVSDVFSPYQNISGGVQYIRRQLDNFGNNIALALAAYNAGPGAVFEYGGIPPYEETQNYVSLIISDYLSAAKVAKRGNGRIIAEKNEIIKKIDVLSTLSKMKNSPDDATGSGTCSVAAPVVNNGQGTDIIPVSSVTGNTSSENLLQNRSTITGNPLENRPTVKVPGF